MYKSQVPFYFGGNSQLSAFLPLEKLNNELKQEDKMLSTQTFYFKKPLASLCIIRKSLKG